MRKSSFMISALLMFSACGGKKAQTQKVDSCYIIDKTGKRLFQVDNDMIYTGNDIIYSEGLAVVYGKGKYEKKHGFMDKTGRITFCRE